MDVSVGHLNNRLALQLPRELPLGLVFVVGTIDGWQQMPTAVSTKNNRVIYEFNLVEDGYWLHCRLLARTMLELDLDDGVRVRVGGHLRFDAQRATYYLLARDIEPLQPTAVADPDPDELPDDDDVLALLADIRERDKAARLPRADLPPWVQRLAPAELQEEQDDAPQTAVDADDDAPLDEELVTYLSDAIDQEQDVELTDDVLAQFTPEADEAADDLTETTPADDDGDAATFPPPPAVDDAMADTPVEMPPEKMARFQQKRPSAEIDWLVVLLVAALLLVAAIVTIALLA